VKSDNYYPESDGLPIADNTLQFRWIVTIVEGLRALFRDDPNVFVAGDLFWYPVEGAPHIRRAPDGMVVFGRPKGDRSSYLQWLEDDIAPQVVFEVLSPGNTLAEMGQKFEFYDLYGVEEYYLYDPHSNDLSGWTRRDERLRVIEHIEGWTSPRLGVRFELDELDLRMESGFSPLRSWTSNTDRSRSLVSRPNNGLSMLNTVPNNLLHASAQWGSTRTQWNNR
jgi:Uma2 family endonuclease